MAEQQQTQPQRPPPQPKIVIEHLEETLGDWCLAEYRNIAKLVGAENVLITHIAPADVEKLNLPGVQTTAESVTTLGLQRIALLDDLALEQDHLKPSDREKFDYFLFGGILGDHPALDRTSFMRPFATALRHLGPEQMSTDGAVNVTWRILMQGQELEKLKFCPFPLEIKVNQRESVELPFKYLEGEDGEPLLPPGLKELLLSDFKIDENADWVLSAEDILEDQ